MSQFPGEDAKRHSILHPHPHHQKSCDLGEQSSLPHGGCESPGNLFEERTEKLSLHQSFW